MGVDMQVIKPPPPQCYYAVPLEIAVQAAQIVNDGIAEFVASKPDRLKGFGSVPMPDGNEAAKELERCVAKLGFKGVQILTNVNGRSFPTPPSRRSGRRPRSSAPSSSSIPTASRTPSACRASTSTTSSATRWRRRLRCTTSSSTACSSGTPT